MNPTNTEFSIAIEQLQVGIYVYLDVGWMEHPFSFNNFKIKNEEQLQAIRTLGLSSVRWDPNRSDCKPLPVKPEAAPKPIESDDDAKQQIMAAKQQRIERLQTYRSRMLLVEKAFADAGNTARFIGKNLFSQPKQTVEQAEKLIGQMIEVLLSAPELAIHVMSEKQIGDSAYFHNLNVSVLSMMLGREMQLSKEMIATLGLGSLFHDIGLSEIPAKIINQTEPLSKPEREFREMHCDYGVQLGKKLALPAPVLQIIQQHHEYYDGAGYPNRNKGEAIDLLSRIVSIVNFYDNLCNPTHAPAAVTPHEALSQMFSSYRGKFDPKILKVFIRCMGVYPPGTVVRLSNEATGLVVAVNASRPLKPSVIVFDQAVPKSEAIMIDLDREPDINISKAIRPDQLPRAVFDYLNPRKRVSYYFDANNSEQRRAA